jgi:hypothetical protein
MQPGSYAPLEKQIERERANNPEVMCCTRARNISKRGTSALKSPELGTFLARVVPCLGSDLGIFLGSWPSNRGVLRQRDVLKVCYNQNNGDENG